MGSANGEETLFGGPCPQWLPESLKVLLWVGRKTDQIVLSSFLTWLSSSSCSQWNHSVLQRERALPLGKVLPDFLRESASPTPCPRLVDPGPRSRSAISTANIQRRDQPCGKGGDIETREMQKSHVPQVGLKCLICSRFEPQDFLSLRFAFPEPQTSLPSPSLHLFRFLPYLPPRCYSVTVCSVTCPPPPHILKLGQPIL